MGERVGKKVFFFILVIRLINFHTMATGFFRYGTLQKVDYFSLMYDKQNAAKASCYYGFSSLVRATTLIIDGRQAELVKCNS